ncbi:MAG: ribonuclease E/G [Pseudomonadota bacterium]
MQRILIQPFSTGLRSALLKNGTLTDLAFERPVLAKQANLDDVMCGRVLSVRRDFVWFDLGLDIEGVVKTSLFHHTNKPHEGMFLWLQVARVPWPEIGSIVHHEKGYRLTPYITLAGRYWLHNPFARRDSKWIHRTAAYGKADDSPELVEEKEELFRHAIRLHVPPTKLGIFERALTQWQRWIRDSEDNVVITCETPAVAQLVKEWVLTAFPEKVEAITLALQTETQLFESFGIEDRWAEVLSPHVLLPGGGSLDIRELAAATLIDINTGGQRDDFFNVNLKALKAIVQQIQWRNITGNILVDFVRLTKIAQVDFLKHANDAFQGTDVHVLGFCELGLLQLQRTRHRPSLLMELMQQCPTCHGDGLVNGF